MGVCVLQLTRDWLWDGSVLAKVVVGQGEGLDRGGGRPRSQVSLVAHLEAEPG